MIWSSIDKNLLKTERNYALFFKSHVKRIERALLNRDYQALIIKLDQLIKTTKKSVSENKSEETILSQIEIFKSIISKTVYYNT